MRETATTITSFTMQTCDICGGEAFGLHQIGDVRGCLSCKMAMLDVMATPDAVRPTLNDAIAVRFRSFRGRR